MGFKDKFKKIFKSDKNEYENNSDDKIIESNADREIKADNDMKESLRNFRYLDDLIHSGTKEIILDSDIALDDLEASQYSHGIQLDVDDILIDANGHTIDACGKGRIFESTAENITVKNATLKGGFCTDNGGAIRLNGGEMSLIESVLSENEVRGEEVNGGAIFNDNATLKITYCRFTDNKSQNRSGGAIFNSAGKLSLSDSAFSRNSSEVGGGAIGNTGDVTITDTAFRDNTSTYGGAIGNGGELSLTQCEFIENTSKSEGGAINTSRKTTITDSSFLKNNTGKYGGAISNEGTLTVKNSQINENSSKNNGGGIYNKNGNLIISDCELSQNTCENRGGAINNDDKSDLTVENCIFSQNSSDGEGGAIENHHSKISIKKSQFTENTVNMDSRIGGAISSYEGDVTILDSNFIKNTSTGWGGAINNKRSALKISKSTFDKNTTRVGGGAILNHGKSEILKSSFNSNASGFQAGAILNTDELKIKDTIFKDNSAKKDDYSINNADEGNCIFEDVIFQNESSKDISNNGELTIKSEFSSNKKKSIDNQKRIFISSKNIKGYIDGPGEVIELNGVKEGEKDFTYLNELIESGSDEIRLEEDIVLNIENNEDMTFKDGITIDNDNLIIDGNGHSIDGQSLARIFMCESGNITIKNVIFKNGFSKGNGGAIYNSFAKLTILNSVFENNTSEKSGGAISNDDYLLTVKDSSFIKNTSGRDGGAISNWDDLNILECTFRANNSNSGGGIYNYGTASITNSTFCENTYEGHVGIVNERREDTINKRLGGAINNAGEVKITKSQFTKNRLAINNTGTARIEKSKFRQNDRTINNYETELTVEESNFTKNSGRVIDNSRAPLQIKKSEFNENDITRSEIIYNLFGEISIEESSFTKNSGRVLESRSGKVDIKHSSFNENTSNFNGGAIKSDKATISISKSVLDKNTAENGGAIYNTGGRVKITDSTLSKNVAKSDGAVIYHEEGDFKIFDCEILHNSALNNIILNRDSLQLQNSNFTDNTSKNIIFNDTESNLGIFASEFVKNSASKALILNQGKYGVVEKTSFKDNIFTDNPVNIVNHTNMTLASPKITDEGKSIINEGYMLIKNSSEDILSKIYGKGTVETNVIPKEEKFDFGYLDRKIRENNTGEIILDSDINFENYEIDYYEGGIELDINGLVIDGNNRIIDAKGKSRIFLITTDNITLKNIIFKNGHSHKSYDSPSNSSGGAVKINHAKNITIENCTFVESISEQNAGAIFNSGKLDIRKSVFDKNTAQSHGGAICNTGKVNIEKTKISKNTAKSSGGAVHNYLGDLTVHKCEINLNSARKRFGGAIYNIKGSLSIKKSSLNQNTSNKGSGGAIYNKKGHVMISECKIKCNTAHGRYSRGGAIYNTEGSLTMDEYKIKKYQPTNYSFGIYKSELTSNTASDSGGAIYNDEWRGLSIEDSSFSNNRSELRGGAIDNLGTVNIKDSLFNENRSSQGGAIQIYQKYKSRYHEKNVIFENNLPNDVYERRL